MTTNHTTPETARRAELNNYEICYRGEIVATTNYPTRFINSAVAQRIAQKLGRHYTWVVRLAGNIVAEYADIRIGGRIA